MKNQENTTIVVFRKWKPKHGRMNDIIALFPGIDEGNGKCLSYEHVGQHGGADYQGVVSLTIPATPKEYAALKRELESEPFNYRFRVLKHSPGWRHLNPSR